MRYPFPKGATRFFCVSASAVSEFCKIAILNGGSGLLRKAIYIPSKSNIHASVSVPRALRGIIALFVELRPRAFILPLMWRTFGPLATPSLQPFKLALPHGITTHPMPRTHHGQNRRALHLWLPCSGFLTFKQVRRMAGEAIGEGAIRCPARRASSVISLRAFFSTFSAPLALNHHVQRNSYVS